MAQAKTVTSEKNELIWQDLQRTLRNFFVFAIPAFLAFLQALQQGGDFTFALGAFYQAIMASVIDMLIKYKQEKIYTL